MAQKTMKDLLLMMNAAKHFAALDRPHASGTLSPGTAA